MKAARTARPRRPTSSARASATSTDQLFRMRIQKSMGQLEAPRQDARRCAAICARVKTVLAREGQGPGQ